MAQKANETSREELLIRDVKILFDENRELKSYIETLKSYVMDLKKENKELARRLANKDEFEEIAFFIKSQRKSLKLSYGAMARLFDIGSTTIENYEKCRGSFKNAVAFAEKIREYRRKYVRENK